LSEPISRLLHLTTTLVGEVAVFTSSVELRIQVNQRTIYFQD